MNYEIYDNFKKTKAPKIEYIDFYGNERLKYAPEAYGNNMEKSDKTGRKIRYVVIKDGIKQSIESAFGVRGTSDTAYYKLFKKIIKEGVLVDFINTFDFDIFKDFNEFSDEMSKVNKVIPGVDHIWRRVYAMSITQGYFLWVADNFYKNKK